MNKIRNIYTLGTSFTNGGGFEFWSYNSKKLKNAYSDIGEELNQFNFSYPGQLKKIINDDRINIINLSKSGYGNELLYSETYRVINDSNFNKERDVFLLEFSFLGRTQIFSRAINKPIILNWTPIYEDKTRTEPSRYNYDGYAYTYWDNESDEQKTLKKLQPDYDKFFTKFVDKFFDSHYQTKLLEINVLTFLCYLVKNNINFYFTQPPLAIDVKYFNKLEWDSKIIDFSKDSNGFMLDYALVTKKGSCLISSETHGYIEDGHTGIVGNKMIANRIYNHLVKDGWIDGNQIEINKDDLENIKRIITKNVSKYHMI